MEILLLGAEHTWMRKKKKKTSGKNCLRFVLIYINNNLKAMRQLFITFVIVLFTLPVSAQKSWYMGVAVSNTQPAYPFEKFIGLFKDALHPGIELSYGNNFSHRKKHDWFYEFQLGYFFHRYVQHGI